ncbi:MAG: type II toxin-antitoxin system RelE/ParE family toxin [bacterium]|nr:type II toxin-antitoxin system RelE/ParE family toxin [bacterium]
MSYKLIIFDQKVFAKDISKIDKQELHVIREKIKQLQNDGITHAQVKRLKSYPVADFRLRVGSYRVLFDFSLETKEIILFRVLHRSKLY